MINESDWSRQNLGVDTTSGTQLHQTLLWGRGWLVRLPNKGTSTTCINPMASMYYAVQNGPSRLWLQLCNRESYFIQCHDMQYIWQLKDGDPVLDHQVTKIIISRHTVYVEHGGLIITCHI